MGKNKCVYFRCYFKQKVNDLESTFHCDDRVSEPYQLFCQPAVTPCVYKQERVYKVNACTKRFQWYSKTIHVGKIGNEQRYMHLQSDQSVLVKQDAHLCAYSIQIRDMQYVLCQNVEVSTLGFEMVA